MENAKKTTTSKDEAVPMEQPLEANHKKEIKSQVLAAIGRPPRLDRVEVFRLHGRKYRVNIWQKPESERNLAVTIAPLIGLSYYLTVSDTGEIIDSNPPLPKLFSSA